MTKGGGVLMERDKEAYETIGVSLLQGLIGAVDEIETPLGADRPALQPL